MAESDAKKKFEMIMKEIHEEFEEAQKESRKKESRNIELDSKKMIKEKRSESV